MCSIPFPSRRCHVPCLAVPFCNIAFVAVPFQTLVFSAIHTREFLRICKAVDTIAAEQINTTLQCVQKEMQKWAVASEANLASDASFAK